MADPLRPGSDSAGGAAVPPGLVSSKTSDTRNEDNGLSAPSAVKAVVMERIPARLKRMRKMVSQSAELLQGEAGQGGFRWWAVLVTLTYAADQDWQSGQVTGFIKSVREYLRRKRIPARYVWVIELTKNGRPHYHVLFFLPHGRRLPKPDLRGWWPYGMTKIEKAFSPVGYLVKYASKGVPEMDDPAAPAIPKGARLSGNGGLSKAARQLRSWRLAPAWVRELFTVEDRPIRAPGGGWMSRLTGRLEPPQWRIKNRAADWSWIEFERIREDDGSIVLACLDPHKKSGARPDSKLLINLVGAGGIEPPTPAV